MSAASTVGKVVVPPLIVGGLFVGVWEVVVRALRPQAVPAAGTVGDLDRARRQLSDVWDAMFVTGRTRSSVSSSALSSASHSASC